VLMTRLAGSYTVCLTHFVLTAVDPSMQLDSCILHDVSRLAASSACVTMLPKYPPTTTCLDEQYSSMLPVFELHSNSLADAVPDALP
jgi:hypothetical protein